MVYLLCEGTICFCAKNLYDFYQSTVLLELSLLSIFGFSQKLFNACNSTTMTHQNSNSKYAMECITANMARQLINLHHHGKKKEQMMVMMWRWSA